MSTDDAERLTARPTVHDTYGRRSPFASSSKPPILQRYVPLTGSLKGYSGDRLRVDAIAGLTVAALALPAGMAYAELAGLPVTAGLYALLLPVLVYAGLGATRRGVIGPEGAVALLVATALAPLAVAGSPEYTALAAALAIAVGCVFVFARLLHLGWLADYFSQSVLVGYISGVAILMALGQLSKLTGVSSDADGEIRAAVDTLARLGDANPWTVGVGLVSLAILVALQRLAPRWPGALIVVVLGMLASWALDLGARGVALTGPVPAGLPELARPDVDAAGLTSLILPAFAIFLVSFADAILTARSFAAKHRETVDADQELLAFGAASIASGFSQGMPIGASGSRTAVNDSMRATTQISGVVAFTAIALILLFLTAPIQYLPSAVLGAIILFASLRLIDVVQWRALGTEQPLRGGHRGNHRLLRHRDRSARRHRGRRGPVDRRRCPARRGTRRRRSGLVRAGRALLGRAVPPGRRHHPRRRGLSADRTAVLRQRALLQASHLGGCRRRPQACASRRARCERHLRHRCQRSRRRRRSPCRLPGPQHHYGDRGSHDRPSAALRRDRSDGHRRSRPLPPHRGCGRRGHESADLVSFRGLRLPARPGSVRGRDRSRRQSV